MSEDAWSVLRRRSALPKDRLRHANVQAIERDDFTENLRRVMHQVRGRGELAFLGQAAVVQTKLVSFHSVIHSERERLLVGRQGKPEAALRLRRDGRGSECERDEGVRETTRARQRARSFVAKSHDPGIWGSTV